MSAQAVVRLLPDLEVRPTLRELAIAYVCRCYDIKPSELFGPSKSRHLVLARALFVWIVREYRPRVSPNTIGMWLHRDRGSINNLLRKAEGLLANDDEFEQECARFATFYARHGGEAI